MNIINLNKFNERQEILQKDFFAAQPYRHIIVDNFFLSEHATAMATSFPSVQGMAMSSAFSGIAESKQQLSSLALLPTIFKNAFASMMDPSFLTLLAKMTGINPLLPDPDLSGGGLHQGGHGSFLDIHADFNKHPKTGQYRRLNILVYLNKDWPEEYGGHLEMWNSNMTRCIKKVAPIFNRCVIFATDRRSFHGYRKMTLPVGVTRKSIAAYYYHMQPAPGEDTHFHNTLFQARPGEVRNAILYPLLRLPLIQMLGKILGRMVG